MAKLVIFDMGTFFDDHVKTIEIYLESSMLSISTASFSTSFSIFL